MNFRWKSWQRQETGEQKLNPFIATRRGNILPRHENILPSFFEYSVKAWKYLPNFEYSAVAWKYSAEAWKYLDLPFKYSAKVKKNPGRYEKRVGEAELAEARLAKAEPDPGRENQQKTKYKIQSRIIQDKGKKRQKTKTAKFWTRQQSTNTKGKRQKNTKKNECWAVELIILPA